MKIPTALAPTAELATPRVRKFVERIIEHLGPPARVTDFYLCNPPTNEILSFALPDGVKWIEANWGLTIEADRFDTMSLKDIMSESTVIGVGEDVTIYPKDPRTLQVKFWLYARVMRH